MEDLDLIICEMKKDFQSILIHKPIVQNSWHFTKPSHRNIECLL